MAFLQIAIPQIAIPRMVFLRMFHRRVLRPDLRSVQRLILYLRFDRASLQPRRFHRRWGRVCPGVCPLIVFWPVSWFPPWLGSCSRFTTMLDMRVIMAIPTCLRKAIIRTLCSLWFMRLKSLPRTSLMYFSPSSSRGLFSRSSMGISCMKSSRSLIRFAWTSRAGSKGAVGTELGCRSCPGHLCR